MFSNYSKKIKLNSEDDQCEDQNEVKSERSKESLQSVTFKLECLPDEVILKVFSYLENMADRIHCGHVSQRPRAISSDKSLWQKMNLFIKIVPTSFLQFVLERGCKFLSLQQTSLKGSLNLTKPTKLKYLNLNSNTAEHGNGTLEKLLAVCDSLENLTLSVRDQYYCRLSTFSMITRLCRQNRQTLKVLYFQVFHDYMDSDIIQHVVLSCSELKEVSIISKGVQQNSINCLVNNLSLNVEKLRLDMSDITDEHVETLVKRCVKLTELILESNCITNKSVTIIQKHLPNLNKLKCFIQGVTFGYDLK